MCRRRALDVARLELPLAQCRCCVWRRSVQEVLRFKRHTEPPGCARGSNVRSTTPAGSARTTATPAQHLQLTGQFATSRSAAEIPERLRRIGRNATTTPDRLPGPRLGTAAQSTPIGHATGRHSQSYLSRSHADPPRTRATRRGWNFVLLRRLTTSRRSVTSALLPVPVCRGNTLPEWPGLGTVGTSRTGGWFLPDRPRPSTSGRHTP